MTSGTLGEDNLPYTMTALRLLSVTLLFKGRYYLEGGRKDFIVCW